jgi:hypothetical protein
MDKIPLVWLNYNPEVIARGYWDQGMLEDIFSNQMWPTGYEFEHKESISVRGFGNGAIIIFPARNQVKYIKNLNEDIKIFDWVILFLTGDEESDFPVEKIKHPNIKIWVMSPRPDRHQNYDKLGTGYPPQMRGLMPSSAPQKPLDYFFAGQITHPKRAEMQRWLEAVMKWEGLKGEAVFTKGFTEGLKHEDYFRKMSKAKTVPAPSGPETPDSFRLFEALEAGAIPIADNKEYWDFFFGEADLFPNLDNWKYLQGYIGDQVALYPSKHNKVFAWWQDYKRKMVLKISDQIKELSGVEPSNNQITILMPTSPYSIHPSTDHIEQTVRDTRVQLPNEEIIIMVDGIRPEKESLRANYDEYKRRLLWLANYQWHNVRLVIFDEFQHQSGMVKKVLPEVKTPLILFVEHDAPLDPIFPIPFDKLGEIILSGQANAIRFLHEGIILPDYKHMMIGEPEIINGVPLLRTAQWSQRPHLASTAFYRHIMETYFTEQSRAFIEHGIYGKIVEAYNIDGVPGWNLWKLWIYYPDEKNIKRSYDLNTRGSDPNYDSTF